MLLVPLQSRNRCCICLLVRKRVRLLSREKGDFVVPKSASLNPSFGSIEMIPLFCKSDQSFLSMLVFLVVSGDVFSRDLSLKNSRPFYL